jgi:cell division protease FtsH
MKISRAAEPFIKCSLEQFTESLIRGNGFGHETLWLKNYFNGQKFSVTEEMKGQYEHNLCQFVMAKYFESLGYQKVLETFYDEGGEIAVTFENLEYDHKKYVQVYKQAFVLYERDEEKIGISINKFSPREIIYRAYAINKQNSVLADWMNYARKNNLYKGKKIDGHCGFIQISDMGWDDIIIPAETRKVIQENIGEMFDMREILAANGISLKGGVILAGPPGTGKTVICKTVAKEVDATVIYAMPDHLANITDIKRVCEMAKDLAPCMLIIEDIDYIAEDRNENHNKGHVIELMNYLDGVQEFKDVVTLATTNAVEILENAVKNRPGRFDRVITVPNPTEECRLRMFKQFTSKFEFNGELNFEKLVKETKGLSGAHIKDLCKTAARQAIREKSLNANKIAIIQQSHFDIALKEVKNVDYSSYNKAQQKRSSRLGFVDYDDD